MADRRESDDALLMHIGGTGGSNHSTTSSNSPTKILSQNPLEALSADRSNVRRRAHSEHSRKNNSAFFPGHVVHSWWKQMIQLQCFL